MRKAGSVAGYRHSDEAKAKNSAKAKAMWESMSPEQRAEKAKIHSETMTGRQMSEETKRKMSESHKARKPTPASIANFNARNGPKALATRAAKLKIRFIATDPLGIEYQVKSLTAFCKEHGLSQTHMTAVARGKRNHHKSWLCRYVELGPQPS